ncbi:MAG: hypothetical protein AVDCRST_MAG64-3306 [uncultured Phycisphaerae bacterium]|uniref:Uncharacterized protein n=1 Tax=uncultured Phycisphaerae bacterium TaxID=904963 RepID=A0A6J4Q4R6_9BACT|nr:MAG: hypothetical protein AVDCRST_MAG64-3306 [uncultured Phycisphaerae bacterium]
MTLTIDLPSELEARLREAAARQGVDARLYVLRAVEERLGPSQARLSPVEADLLQRVNLGLPEPAWARYHELVAKRRGETLSGEEHAELIALSDRIEELNARRIEHLIALARVRGVTLDALMAQLGITPPNG